MVVPRRQHEFGFPSPSTIACSFVFNPPLVRPIALSAVFSPSIGTSMNLDASRVQTQVFHIRICGQHTKHGFQCAVVPPFGKSGVHRLPRTIRLRQFPPLRSAAGNPKHPIEHFPIIFPWTSPLPCPFWREYRFHTLPLFFCQFIPFHVPIFALTVVLCNIYFSNRAYLCKTPGDLTLTLFPGFLPSQFSKLYP